MTVNKIRRNGSYAPLSAHYYKDDAMDEAGEAAELLYVRGLAFCADVLSDGFISDRQLVRFVGVGMFDAPDRAARLVQVGLWEGVEGGYQVRSWLHWNRSRADITDAQAKDAARKGRSGESDRTDPPPPNGGGQSSNGTPDGFRVESDRKGARPPSGVQPHAGAHARTPRNSTPLQEELLAIADATTEPDLVDDPFDEFWSLYPRRVKKVDARKAWDQVMRRKVTAAHVLQAAARQASEWRAVGKAVEFIPYPASWLRGGSYDDEPEQTHLSVVPALPVGNPDERMAQLRETANGRAAAELIGRPYLPKSQPPSDRTPAAEWDRREAQRFLTEHEPEIRDALAEREAG